MPDAGHRNETHVKVSFPISKHGPFQTEVAVDTTAGVILAAAKDHFEVQDDTQFTYVLAHDGVEVDAATTVGSIAGQARDVRFTLVKKITQG